MAARASRAHAVLTSDPLLREARTEHDGVRSILQRSRTAGVDDLLAGRQCPVR